MEIWSGCIGTSSDLLLEGIRFVNTDTKYQCHIPNDARLSVHCFVNPSLIPLYARVGPSVELHSNNAQTLQWLKDKLLSDIWLRQEELEQRRSMQCPIGLLISVEYNRGGRHLRCDLTDLLVYATLSIPQATKRCPSPPIPSFPGYYGASDLHAIRWELKIYAVPLSASLVTKARGLPSPPLSPPNDDVDSHPKFAEFVPDPRSPSPKRKRMFALFDIAAQHHRKVRQRGGEAVSQLMANTSSQATPQLPPSKIKKEPEDPSDKALEKISSQRSRSLSLVGSSHPSKGSHMQIENGRPATVKNQVRCGTSRLSTPNPLLESQNRVSFSSSFAIGGDIDSTSAQEPARKVMSENKAVITRTILTCMRLYGFHRDAPRSASMNSNATVAAVQTDLGMLNEDTLSPTTSPDEEEFKAMYHAMYKASTYALRRYLREPRSDGQTGESLPPVLDKEKAMNLVDELLRLFCEED